MNNFYRFCICIFIITVISTNSAYSILAKGLYFSTKFYYDHDANNAYTKQDGSMGLYNYLGASFSLGYGIPTKNTVSPFRIEVEYSIGEAVSVPSKTQIHNILASFYYDINFIFAEKRFTKNKESRSKLFQTEYPLFSIFLGASMGAKITTADNVQVSDENISNVARRALAFGFTVGFSYYILEWLNFDIGYRFLIDVAPKWNNEIFAGFRFTIP